MQLNELLACLSSRRAQQFQDERDDVVEALMNTSHFQSFKMRKDLKQALMKCVPELGYFLFPPSKILHQYGKSSDNIYFILQGEANVYEYKQDSELELECYFTAHLSELNENIQKLVDQKQAKTTNNPMATISDDANNKTNTNLKLNAMSLNEIESELKVLQLEAHGVESMLRDRFGAFDEQNDIISEFKQFFMEGVCMLRFKKRLVQCDSFSVMENNRDQIIVSATEIHLTNLSTVKYQRYLVPLKARNEYFAYHLKQSLLDKLFQPYDLTQQVYLRTMFVYDSTNTRDTSTIYLVCSGMLSLAQPTSNTSSASMLVLRYLKPGDFFGIEDLFDKTRGFRVKCETELATVISCRLAVFEGSSGQNTGNNLSFAFEDTDEDNKQQPSKWLIDSDCSQSLKDIFKGYYDSLSNCEVEDMRKRGTKSIAESTKLMLMSLSKRIDERQNQSNLEKDNQSKKKEEELDTKIITDKNSNTNHGNTDSETKMIEQSTVDSRNIIDKDHPSEKVPVVVFNIAASPSPPSTKLKTEGDALEPTHSTLNSLEAFRLQTETLEVSPLKSDRPGNSISNNNSTRKSIKFGGRQTINNNNNHKQIVAFSDTNDTSQSMMAQSSHPTASPLILKRELLPETRKSIVNQTKFNNNNINKNNNSLKNQGKKDSLAGSNQTASFQTANSKQALSITNTSNQSQTLTPETLPSISPPQVTKQIELEQSQQQQYYILPPNQQQQHQHPSNFDYSNTSLNNNTSQSTSIFLGRNVTNIRTMTEEQIINDEINSGFGKLLQQQQSLQNHPQYFHPTNLSQSYQKEEHQQISNNIDNILSNKQPNTPKLAPIQFSQQLQQQYLTNSKSKPNQNIKNNNLATSINSNQLSNPNVAMDQLHSERQSQPDLQATLPRKNSAAVSSSATKIFHRNTLGGDNLLNSPSILMNTTTGQNQNPHNKRFSQMPASLGKYLNTPQNLTKKSISNTQPSSSQSQTMFHPKGMLQSKTEARSNAKETPQSQTSDLLK